MQISNIYLGVPGGMICVQYPLKEAREDDPKLVEDMVFKTGGTISGQVKLDLTSIPLTQAPDNIYFGIEIYDKHGTNTGESAGAEQTFTGSGTYSFSFAAGVTTVPAGHEIHLVITIKEKAATYTVTIHTDGSSYFELPLEPVLEVTPPTGTPVLEDEGGDAPANLDIRAMWVLDNEDDFVIVLKITDLNRSVKQRFIARLFTTGNEYKISASVFDETTGHFTFEVEDDASKMSRTNLEGDLIEGSPGYIFILFPKDLIQEDGYSTPSSFTRFVATAYEHDGSAFVEVDSASLSPTGEESTEGMDLVPIIGVVAVAAVVIGAVLMLKKKNKKSEGEKKEAEGIEVTGKEKK